MSEQFPPMLPQQLRALQRAIELHLIGYSEDFPGLNSDLELVDEVRFNLFCDECELWDEEAVENV